MVLLLVLCCQRGGCLRFMEPAAAFWSLIQVSSCQQRLLRGRPEKQVALGCLTATQLGKYGDHASALGLTVVMPPRLGGRRRRFVVAGTWHTLILPCCTLQTGVCVWLLPILAHGCNLLCSFNAILRNYASAATGFQRRHLAMDGNLIASDFAEYKG